MNSLRKIAAGALAAAMLMSVAACGSANAAGGDNAGQASDANEEWAAATSVADFGSFEDLEVAAKEEGALNVIALPHDWSNWGEVIETFKEKYPEIEVTELNPNASSKEEIDAAKTNAGTDAAPDVFDTGLAVASTNTDYFAPYKVQAWDKIPDELKDPDGLYYGDYTGIMSVGWNKDKYGEIESIDDLLDPKFAGTVALNGKPAEAGAAFNGFVMVNALKGGDLNDYNYNPEKAKELLAEANWDPNTVIKAVYYYTDQATVDLMTAVQAYLADVGIKMEFELVEGDLATILWTAPADQTTGPRAVDWDICYAANAALSLHEYYDRYRTGSPTNSHTPEDAELNRLIDATNASADVNAQNEAFKELIKYENENLFTMALYYQPIFLITSDKIGDIQKGTPQFCINWGIQNWNVQ